jgi:hypothetical protein
VLGAAAVWRKRCVEADGSLLSTAPLWSESRLSELKRRFQENPIEGSDRDFYEKLHVQLEGAGPEIQMLAAELVWFLILFPHFAKYGVDKKLSQIQTVWEWSGNALPRSEYLSDDCLKGVGNPGTAYLTHRFAQFDFLLEAFHAWKLLSQGARDKLLAGPWEFAAWLDAIPNSDRRPVRNAILYFMYPDVFERNLSNDHRRQIVGALRDRLPPELRPKGKNAPLIQLDKAIAALRSQFEKEFGTAEIDFYRPPLRQMWWTGLREEAREQIASELKKLLSKYGLELRQCGNKKATLSDCYEVDSAKGYWKDPADATNKPLRWLVHFSFEGDRLVAKLPSLHGDKRIAFANTAQGNSGAITARVIPVIETKGGSHVFHETWEWLLLFAFSPALSAGSSGQLIEFDPNSGALIYMSKNQPYIAAALIALNEEEDVIESTDVGKPIRYGEATRALADLVRVSE